MHLVSPLLVVSTAHIAVESCISAAVVSSPEQSISVNLAIIPGYLVLALNLQLGSLFYELHSIL